MKAHLAIYSDPPEQTTGVVSCLCSLCLSKVHVKLTWTGESNSFRELVENFRGLCSPCKKAALTLDIAMGSFPQYRQYVYAVTEGDPEQLAERGQ